jgi:hypothetical protein
VGNFSIGIYNLQILNVSLVDEGIYKCSYTLEGHLSMSILPSVVVILFGLTMGFATGYFFSVEFAYMRLPTI